MKLTSPFEEVPVSSSTASTRLASRTCRTATAVEPKRVATEGGTWAETAVPATETISPLAPPASFITWTMPPLVRSITDTFELLASEFAKSRARDSMLAATSEAWLPETAVVTVEVLVLVTVKLVLVELVMEELVVVAVVPVSVLVVTVAVIVVTVEVVVVRIL